MSSHGCKRGIPLAWAIRTAVGAYWRHNFHDTGDTLDSGLRFTSVFTMMVGVPVEGICSCYTALWLLGGVGRVFDGPSYQPHHHCSEIQCERRPTTSGAEGGQVCQPVGPVILSSSAKYSFLGTWYSPR
jgi:hypothetical protein